MGQKSGQKEADMLRKELEKVRKKSGDAEAKLRAAIQVGQPPVSPRAIHPVLCRGACLR